MKQLLNTLFVTSEDIYLSLDGENVVANRSGTAVARYPLHTLQSIVSFAYSGASPALMGACVRRNIGLAFCQPNGRFLARVSGTEHGNILLKPRYEVLHVRAAGRRRKRAAGDSEHDQYQTVENALLLFQLLRALQQIENLRVVIDPHAVLHRVLAVHQLGQRYGQRLTERLDYAVIRHTLAVFPFGD